MRTTRTPLKGVARKLRSNGTDAERRLWRHLRNRQLDGHKFRRQFPLGRYVADFICLEAMLCVEVDGGQHADQVLGDARRTAHFTGRGLRVLRFWNDEVLRDTPTVLQVIREALRASPAGPSP